VTSKMLGTLPEMASPQCLRAYPVLTCVCCTSDVLAAAACVFAVSVRQSLLDRQLCCLLSGFDLGLLTVRDVFVVC
jgi:hypothetical protein